jgi:hypothetical protein
VAGLRLQHRRAARKDLLVRLLALRDSSESEREDFPVAAQLMLADEADALRIIEAASMADLKKGGCGSAVDLAYALMEGRWPALGILISHGLIPHRHVMDAEMLFETVLETRDKLNLPPDDPLDTVLNATKPSKPIAILRN